MYREAFEKHGMSPSSVLMPKGRQDVRFESLCRFFRKGNFTILDFGSGLGDLFDFMRPRFSNFQYTGADIVEEFVEASRKARPDGTFVQIEDHRSLVKTYDYVAIAGVFNTLYNQEANIHRAYVFDAVEYLFSLTKDCLAINFMTDAVDFRQAGAYHQNPVELCEFVNRKLSRRWILDQSYMPYEFTLTIFCDDEIQRPENIYRS